MAQYTLAVGVHLAADIRPIAMLVPTFFDLTDLAHLSLDSWSSRVVRKLLDHWPVHEMNLVVGFDATSETTAFGLDDARAAIASGNRLEPPAIPGWGRVPEAALPWSFGTYLCPRPVNSPAALLRLERLIDRAASRVIVIDLEVQPLNANAVMTSRVERAMQRCGAVIAIGEPASGLESIRIAPGVDDFGRATFPRPRDLPLLPVIAPPNRLEGSPLEPGLRALMDRQDCELVLLRSTARTHRCLPPSSLPNHLGIPEKTVKDDLDLISILERSVGVIHLDQASDTPIRAGAIEALGVPVLRAEPDAVASETTFLQTTQELLCPLANDQRRNEFADTSMPTWADAASQVAKVLRSVTRFERP